MMVQMKWLAGALVLLTGALAACQPVPSAVDTSATPVAESPVVEQPAGETPAVLRPTAEPASEEQAPAQPPSTGVGMAEADLPPAALAMRQLLAQQVGLDLTGIAVIEAEAVEWSDSCLGAGGPEEMCAAVITPGYRIVLEANGGRYIYHTDLEGNQFRMVDAPEANAGDSIIEWTGASDEGACRKVVVGTEGVVFGGCYTNLAMGGRLVMAQRDADLDYFRSTFAPFTATTAAGDVTFYGAGAQEATPAEQRLIGEWMRIVLAEASAGRSSAGLGFIFGVLRDGGIAALCQNVSVYATGIAYVADCRSEPPLTLPVVRLSAEQIEEVYGWFDTLQSFEETRVDGTADVLTTTVSFYGLGATQASDEEKAAIERLAGALAAQAEEIAAVRIGSCPEAEEGQALYRSDALGYCVLYPATHAPVESEGEGTVFVVGGDLMQHAAPRMEIVVSEASGTAEDAAAALAAEVSQAMAPEDLPHTVVALGPVGAVVLDQVPGQDLRRMLFAVHNGRLYTITLTPADGEIEELYTLVVDSFSFMN